MPTRDAQSVLNMTSLVTLLTFGLAALTVASPIGDLAPRAVTCYPNYVIAARGSGEEPWYSKLLPLNEQLGGFAYVDNLTYPATFWFEDAYNASVSQGVTNLNSVIRNYVDTCGASSKIALVGFSQGGQVITSLLGGGYTNPTVLSSKYLPYIKAVTVFGDPTFNATAKAINAGTYNPAKSGLYAHNATTVKKLLTLSNVLKSYCDNDDEFCNQDKTPTSNDVHGNEVKDNQNAALKFIKARLVN